MSAIAMKDKRSAVCYVSLSWNGKYAITAARSVEMFRWLTSRRNNLGVFAGFNEVIRHVFAY